MNETFSHSVNFKFGIMSCANLKKTPMNLKFQDNREKSEKDEKYRMRVNKILTIPVNKKDFSLVKQSFRNSIT